MNLHDLIGYLVHRTDVKMSNYFTKRLKPYGVTPEQWGIISVLSSQRGTTQRELAEAIDKDQTTVVRMIQSMERKEIVKKTLNEQDRRSHNLFLTEKGDELKKAILPVVQDAHNFVTSNLSEEEIEQLKTLLNKLYGTRY
ncbi:MULTISPECIES: MarR family winged helix-turn-helix transcriptional regulator [Bacillus]|uniref:MarR family winged helix-turn-helix transcriptional regulator n=1 Tax=Bacillus TaxID=1386 RepID=UPI0005B72876|nr:MULTISPECIES: MarR family winged helix-turn-helix transcriptional regulator [Bacillus]KIQ80919.1 MarR family transcriptional regulator [Bacillus sp. L_1B0_8]KIQ85354.1 MarR family transcriptional regulator [Bacillus sp. L_1B0_5]MCA0999160.1 MarR family winged helix-turn-helix transcriptional regulator [Bacillus thuringiensis]MCU7675699.1 MarR family winged helix-turn-helix transcriptional regulator [Bacillus thuringiensis]MED2806518.1 MarR family winged helix-turn-helix transcriptional regu